MNKRVYNALRKIASVGADELITGGLAGLGTFGLAKAFGADTGLATTLAVPAAVAGGYLRNRYNDNRESELKSSALKSYRDARDSNIRNIAHQLGISRWDNMPVEDLLSDIRVRLSNEDSYYGNFLNDKEIKLLDGFLAGQQQTLKTIKNYHDYLTRIKGQKAIVLLNDR